VCCSVMQCVAVCRSVLQCVAVLSWVWYGWEIVFNCRASHICDAMHYSAHLWMMCVIQPITDRVAQHLDIIFKNFQFGTRRTRILMGFIIHYLILIVNPMGRILVRRKFFRNNLEMLCHPICNWRFDSHHTYV